MRGVGYQFASMVLTRSLEFREGLDEPMWKPMVLDYCTACK